MSAQPFAGFNPRPSPWGYNWANEGTKATEPKTPAPTQQMNNTCTSPEPELLANQYANMPAALLSSLKRDKKPFTYTPGGVNLNEVLNARLQKRLERKKKYQEEKMASSNDGLPKFDPPKQVIVMPTYNTPLNMYSMENALEALEVQAELVAADKSLSSPSRSATLPRNHTFRFEDDSDPNRGVIQSKAFKVLQIITDTEEDPSSGKGRPQYQDEMRFTGIRDSKAIPSKFFHTLQKITGTEDDEEEQPSPREMQQVAAPRTTTYERQQTFASRAPQQNSQPQPMFNKVNSKAVSQPMQQQQQQQQPTFGNSNPALKRPAAFLPIKTTPGYRPVQAPSLSNGPVRRSGNFSCGGTDL